MSKIFCLKSSQKLFSIVLFGLIFIPFVTLANTITIPYPNSTVIPYPIYDWPRIILFSLLAFLIMFLVWLISPLGIIFISCTLAQFLISKRVVRIIALIFQGLVLAFTILLGIAGLILTLSVYGETKYIFLISIIGTVSTICLLMIGTIIAQIIWQRKK